MTDIAIRCEGLAKQYRIGERERYTALRDVISEAAAAPFRHFANAINHKAEGVVGNGVAIGNRQSSIGNNTIWALDDVSFAVKRGEVVGIIGRNGAGKSTLLKILSRITKPTRGQAEIHGRVGSLLEVGTGFHPELTGRENIFLNGAILGMRKTEIERKFDEIVTFAEVENFIDTPVKRYSSGMYVRLAFAVAAHMDTEILIVDEVLAVGDRAFQAKCLGKLNDFSQSKCTALLVTHQLNQVRRLCSTAVWLEHGKIMQLGRSNEVVAAYEASTLKQRQEIEKNLNGHCFRSWEIQGSANVIRNGLGAVSFRLQLNLATPIRNGHLGIAVLNEENRIAAGWGFDNVDISKGSCSMVLHVPSLPLRPGLYTLLCSLFNEGNNLTGGTQIDRWHATPPLIVEVEELAHPQEQWSGMINVPAKLMVTSS